MSVEVDNEQKFRVRFDLTPLFFDYNLKELIKAKSLILSKIREIELELLKGKSDFADKERIIILTTDFKELGLTNEKMRNAYVNEKLSEAKELIDFKKLEIGVKKDELEIITDLIRLNELELKGD